MELLSSQQMLSAGIEPASQLLATTGVWIPNLSQYQYNPLFRSTRPVIVR